MSNPNKDTSILVTIAFKHIWKYFHNNIIQISVQMSWKKIMNDGNLYKNLNFA